MSHLTENDIDAFVQYKNGNKAYFTLSESKYDEFNDHIENCDLCKNKVNLSDSLFNSIKLEKKTPWYSYSSVAIVLVAVTLFWLTKSDLNENHFITHHDFGFKVSRGNKEPSKQLKQELIYLIYDNQFDKAIELCKKNKMVENNLYYFAALILRGQENDDKKDIENAIKTLTNDSLNQWRTKGEKILSNDTD